MDLQDNWDEVKSLFRDSFRSSFHFAIATVRENGEPHVTPIGGRFLNPPAVRLYGVAGELGAASKHEIALWQERVKPVSFSKGYETM